MVVGITSQKSGAENALGKTEALGAIRRVLNLPPIEARRQKEKKGGGESRQSRDINTEDSRYWQHGVKRNDVKKKRKAVSRERKESNEKQKHVGDEKHLLHVYNFFVFL